MLFSLLASWQPAALLGVRCLLTGRTVSLNGGLFHTGSLATVTKRSVEGGCESLRHGQDCFPCSADCVAQFLAYTFHVSWLAAS